MRINEIFEIDNELNISKLNYIETRFRVSLLEMGVRDLNRFEFDVAYNNANKNYEINISSLKNNFNSQKYFEKIFKNSEKKEILKDFCKINNVSRFKY